MEKLHVDCQIASRLWEAQLALERAIEIVDVMGREEHHAYLSQPERADRIVLDGRDLARTIREFAAQLDRAVPHRY